MTHRQVLKVDHERRWDQQSYEVCGRFLNAANSIQPFRVQYDEEGRSLQIEQLRVFDFRDELGALVRAQSDLQLLALVTFAMLRQM